jgi:hypothetical protein
MKRGDHGASSRRGRVVLGEGEHYDVTAERVLALTAERERCMRLHQLSSVEAEGAVLAASLGRGKCSSGALPV